MFIIVIADILELNLYINIFFSVIRLLSIAVNFIFGTVVIMENSRRLEYTYEEKLQIIKFIIKQEGYNELRGNTFWKIMEQKKIIARSWQSMKEHFRKQIVENIYAFDITKKEKYLIRTGWDSSRVKTSRRKRLYHNSFEKSRQDKEKVLVRNASQNHEGSGSKQNNNYLDTAAQSSATNVCEDDQRSFINSIYSQMTINKKQHLFISALNGSKNKSKLSDLLSKKYKLDRQNIHHIKFESENLNEQINKFKTCIYTQFERDITQSLDKCTNVRDAIAGLEVSFKTFSNEDINSSSENMDSSGFGEEQEDDSSTDSKTIQDIIVTVCELMQVI